MTESKVSVAELKIPTDHIVVPPPVYDGTPFDPTIGEGRRPIEIICVHEEFPSEFGELPKGFHWDATLDLTATADVVASLDNAGSSSIDYFVQVKRILSEHGSDIFVRHIEIYM